MSLKTESNSVSKLSKPDANNFIESIMEDDVIDEKTKSFLVGMKNQVFMENVFDLDKKLVVNSIYLNKITKLGRSMSTMVWQYFRHRGKLNVNKLIKQYGRENLTINYKIFQ
jgi:hypothetical protein